MHRLYVEIEREVPILLGAVENTAVMNVPRAIDEHVDRPELGSQLSCERLHGRA